MCSWIPYFILYFSILTDLLLFYWIALLPKLLQIYPIVYRCARKIIILNITNWLEEKLKLKKKFYFRGIADLIPKINVNFKSLLPIDKSKGVSFNIKNLWNVCLFVKSCSIMLFLSISLPETECSTLRHLGVKKIYNIVIMKKEKNKKKSFRFRKRRVNESYG